jgi:peptidoglycan/xylan/chitin deacetylase (PgdA/CDA1 family)
MKSIILRVAMTYSDGRSRFTCFYMRTMLRLLITAIVIGLFASACSAEQVDHADVDTRSAKLIALTFDDGPTQVTPALLDILKRHSAKATFFPMGANIQADPALTRRISAEGHAIGNHTLSHARLTGMSEAEARTEIESANALVREITGQTPEVFRPLYAALDDKVVEIARANGLAIVLWNVYPETLGAVFGSSAISDRVVSKARDGSIVFLHDTSMRSVEAAQTIVQELSANPFGVHRETCVLEHPPNNLALLNPCRNGKYGGHEAPLSLQDLAREFIWFARSPIDEHSAR